MAVEVGKRYQLAHPLGQGGMGTVWRAHDQVLKRDVALKEVQFPSYVPESDRRSLRERVLQEARVAARLSHPGVVTVYDVFEEDDKTFIAMELVDWPPLDRLVGERGPLPEDLVAKIGTGLLQTLSEAHSKGIVHRDVKPGNVMVGPEGTVKLTDFGIASVTGGPHLTRTGMILGSPSYMSPEQAKGEPAGPASDLWALGATLHFAVSGAAPFDKGEALPTLNAILTEEPPVLQGPLGRVIMDLLAKDPLARPDPARLGPLLDGLADGSGSVAGSRTLRMEPAGLPGRADAPGPGTPPAGSASAGFDSGPSTTEPERRFGAGTEPVVQTHGPASKAPERGSRRTEPPTTGSKKTSQWLYPLAALLLVAAVAVALVRLPPAGQSPDETATGRSSGSDDRPASPAPPESRRAADELPGERAVPGNWETFVLGGSGYEISHPPSWRVVRDPLGDGNSVRFADRSGRYLLVDWTDEPGTDAVAAWRSQARSFAQRHQDYREIRIEPATFRDFDTAAIWEFTYSGGGATLHAVDLGFANERLGFALNFQTREADWERSQILFEQFKTSFR